MYNLLIVDDEIISRLGISSLLNWEEEGFSLIDSVANGEEALAIIRNQPIDLVITDIKMPVMTGIELIQEAKSSGFESAFIVLSSYDDYTYVREALKLGAVDYILKLDLDKAHMLSVLDKAKEQIDLANRLDAPIEKIDKQTMNSARRDFLKQILYGQMIFDEAYEQRRNHLKLTMANEKYLVLMFKVQDLGSTLNEDGIRAIIEEVLEEYDYAYICDTGYDELSIIYNMPHKRESDQFQLIQRLASRISFIMRQYFNQKVIIYVSQTFKSVENVPLAYLQVCQTISLKSVMSDAAVVFFDEVISNRNYRDYKSFETYIERFEKAIQRKKDAEIKAIFHELFTYVESSKYIELGQIRYFISSMVYIANHYLDKYGYSDELIWGNDEEKYLMLQEITRKEDFTKFLHSIEDKLSIIGVEDSDNYIVRNVKKHLKQHYKEGIVLKEVAETFGLTNTYLSMLFKKETGETLKDYLTALKIEKAKELLKETNWQVSEIAKEIGYDNEHYFSRIFKQKTEMTPTGYRNSTF